MYNLKYFSNTSIGFYINFVLYVKKYFSQFTDNNGFMYFSISNYPQTTPIMLKSEDLAG